MASRAAGRTWIEAKDQATSALDERSEQAITVALDNLRGSITVLMVAHRPAILATCDGVLTMSGGVFNGDA